MPVEQQSTVTIKGNPNTDMQAAYDTRYDTVVALPAGATHAEIHRGSAPWQNMWWSWYGTVGTWRRIQPPSRLPLGPVRTAVPPAGAPPPPPVVTDIYFRKAYNPRHLSSWPGVNPGRAGIYSGSWAASTNTPALADGAGSDKQYYYVLDIGVVNFGSGPIAFVAGDWVIYDGVTGTWGKAAEDPRTSIADDEMIEITVSFTQD